MHIIASALIIASSIIGAHSPAAPSHRCAEDAIQIRIHEAHRPDKSACLHVDMIAGSIMRDIADESFKMYGAGHAAIIIDSEDGEILIGRAKG